ncbi:Uncharacterised protein [Mycobacteroides abscessus subsp. abscessus]|nr:Uncharacterised protein [Mycobacteroides abscessus subsp. abscessus]
MGLLDTAIVEHPFGRVDDVAHPDRAQPHRGSAPVAERGRREHVVVVAQVRDDVVPRRRGHGDAVEQDY